MEVVNLDELEVRKETKIEMVKRVVREKTNAGKNWVKNNGDKLMDGVAAGVALIGSVCAIVRMVGGTAQDRHDRRVDRQYYDPSTGVHWDLKRKPTNSDRVELMRRKRNGDNTEDILKDLKLIK